MADSRAVAEQPTTDQPPVAYGLARPVVGDGEEALRRVYGHAAGEIWERLLRRAGLAGDETDEDSLTRLLDAMRSAEPVTALVGRALLIRRVSYQNLSAAQSTIRSAQ